jgi:hypothetical protein
VGEKLMARSRRRWSILRQLTLALAMAFGFAALGAESALAVPSFAIQTDHPCQSCHVGGFGPQLTPYGRGFKLYGYTERADIWNVPISAMAVASFIRTLDD